jgi:S-adenosylmethionine/arginine decarboxylase-like enzyme
VKPGSTPPYGYELMLDLHGCEPKLFTRRHLRKFFDQLCEIIEMQKCSIHFWDDVGIAAAERQTQAHTKGTSAVCFILTSSIVIHTLDMLDAVYLNIFSCKEFDQDKAREFAKNWFRANECDAHFLIRR